MPIFLAMARPLTTALTLTVYSLAGSKAVKTVFSLGLSPPLNGCNSVSPS